eukprot:4682578-Lingulodinium_polyedra.AAC.1
MPPPAPRPSAPLRPAARPPPTFLRNPGRSPLRACSATPPPRDSGRRCGAPMPNLWLRTRNTSAGVPSCA